MAITVFVLLYLHHNRRDMRISERNEDGELNRAYIAHKVGAWSPRHIAVYLRVYNEWRTGADIPQPEPYILGRVLLRATELLEKQSL